MSQSPVLFILPHAGGSALQYSRIFPSLRNLCEILCLDLPGHGERTTEPLLHTIPAMAEEVVRMIEAALQKRNKRTFILLGHSMGGLLAYLATVALTLKGLPPKTLFVSSSGLPGRHYVPSGFLEYSDRELWIESARHFGGISEEATRCLELQQHFVPLLRADLAAVVNYTPEATQALDLPVHALYGESDIVDERDVKTWKRLCTGQFSCKSFTGNHFYLLERPEEVEAYMEYVISAEKKSNTLKPSAGTMNTLVNAPVNRAVTPLSCSHCSDSKHRMHNACEAVQG